MKQNLTFALKWFQRASEAGDAQAFYELGLMHEGGLGVPTDTGRSSTNVPACPQRPVILRQQGNSKHAGAVKPLPFTAPARRIAMPPDQDFTD